MNYEEAVKKSRNGKGYRESWIKFNNWKKYVALDSIGIFDREGDDWVIPMGSFKALSELFKAMYGSMEIKGGCVLIGYPVNNIIKLEE